MWKQMNCIGTGKENWVQAVALLVAKAPYPGPGASGPSEHTETRRSEIGDQEGKLKKDNETM